jgi:hypothetical protein
MSLYDFIEANQRLLTAFAAFVALTAFLIQATAGDDALSKFVPGIPLFGALLLILELFLRIPADPAEKSGRLFAFELVVLALGGSLAWMWFQRFPAAWGTVLLLVSFILVVVLAVGIGYVAGIPFRWLLPRLLHRDLKANEQQLVYLVTLVLSIALIWGGLHWLSHKRTSTSATSPPSATLPVKP